VLKKERTFQVIRNFCTKNLLLLYASAEGGRERGYLRFSYMIPLMRFSTKHSFCENIPSLINHLSSLLSWF